MKPTHPARWRIPAIAICIAAAFAAARYQKKQEDPAASIVGSEKPAAVSGLSVLDSIPAPDSQNATDKAVAEFVAKLRAAPGKTDDWVKLGDTLAQKFRDTAEPAFLNHAEAAFHQGLTLDAGSVDAMAGMAWVTGARHDFDKSISWAEKALVLDPAHIAATGIIGDAALELGDYEKAFDFYQKMTDLRPDLSSWSRGAHLLWLTGDRTKGIWLMEKAIKAGAPYAENTAWCRARLAMMLFQDGALLPAEQALAPALRMDSRNPHVLLAAARISAAKRDYPAAIGFCEKLLESGPNHDALAFAGDCHAAAGDLAMAENFYRKVEELHMARETGGAHDHMQMARFYADHDRNPIVALRMAEEHKLTGNVLEADVLAWVYLKNGDLQKAREAVKTALSRNTPDAEMLYHAGMIAAAAGDRQTAKKHLQLALSRNAEFHPLQGKIARETLAALVANPVTATEPAPPQQ